MSLIELSDFGAIANSNMRRLDLLTRPSVSGSSIDLTTISQRSANWVRSTDDGQGFAKDFVGESAEIDVKKATAKFVISTPGEDRYGDVMIPEGCQKHLASYQRNPQVFFGHKSGGFPIGLSLDDAGNPGVQVLPGVNVKATCQFNLATKESEDVFRLVEAKALRTSSIGFRPLIATIEKAGDDEDAPKNQVDFSPWLKFTFKEWELYEWSIVAVPANSECVRLHLEKGFGGKPLAENVRKYLEQFVVKSAPVVVGGFEEKKEPVPVAEEKKASPAPQTTSTGPIAQVPVIPTIAVNGGDGFVRHINAPSGLIALNEFALSLDSTLSGAKALLAVVENNEVHTFVQDSLDATQKACGDVWRLLGMLYPDEAKQLQAPSCVKAPLIVETESVVAPVAEEKSVIDEALLSELLAELSLSRKAQEESVKAQEQNAKALKRITGQV